MLASSDTDGNLFIWEAVDPFRCILQSSNTPRPMSTNTITDLDFYYLDPTKNKDKKQQLLLIAGDEEGMVRIENLGAKNGILDKLPEMVPVPLPKKKDATSTQSSFPMIVSEPVKIAGATAGAGGSGARDANGTFITGTDMG
jgi:hypothetical protein